MPGFVRTKKDEAKWQKAKTAAQKSKKKDEAQFSDRDWALVNHIYHKMSKSARLGSSAGSVIVAAALGDAERLESTLRELKKSASIEETVEELLKSKILSNEDAKPLLNRMEDKYFIKRKHLDAITRVLKKELHEGDSDTSVRYNVNRTIYLDNRDLDCLRDNMASVKPRFKVRIRQYSPNGNEWEDVAYIELKIKTSSGLTKKTRVRIPEDMIAKIVKGDFILPSEQLEDINRDISKDLLWKRVTGINSVIAKYGFKKILTVEYDRRAYSGQDIRVTIDDDIVYFCDKKLDPNAVKAIMSSKYWKDFGDTHDKIRNEDYLILEVKHEGPVPGWLKSLLKDKKAKPVKFSKYCGAVVSYLNSGEKEKGMVSRTSGADLDRLASMMKSDDASSDLRKADDEYNPDDLESYDIGDEDQSGQEGEESEEGEAQSDQQSKEPTVEQFLQNVAEHERAPHRQPVSQAVLDQIRPYTRRYADYLDEKREASADPSENPILHARSHYSKAISDKHKDYHSAKAAFENSPEYKNADIDDQLEMMERFDRNWHLNRPKSDTTSNPIVNAINAHQSSKDIHGHKQKLDAKAVLRGVAADVASAGQSEGEGPQSETEQTLGTMSTEEAGKHLGISRENEDSGPLAISTEINPYAQVKLSPEQKQYLTRKITGRGIDLDDPHAVERLEADLHRQGITEDALEDKMREHQAKFKRVKVELPEDLKNHPDKNKFDRFYNQYFPLAAISARDVLKGEKFRHHADRLETSELTEPALHAMVRAINEYKPEHAAGASFSTYAQALMTGHIKNHLANKDLAAVARKAKAPKESAAMPVGAAGATPAPVVSSAKAKAIESILSGEAPAKQAASAEVPAVEKPAPKKSKIPAQMLSPTQASAFKHVDSQRAAQPKIEPYSEHNSYQAGDKFIHPEHGVGVVAGGTPKKIGVQFEHGRELLDHRVPRSGSEG